MKFILLLGSILAPILMLVLQTKWVKFRIIFNIVAIISALVFGNISSFAIHEIIEDGTVFMTNIHALFLNPIFLMTGAYLGVYVLYLLSLQGMKELTTWITGK